MTCVLGLDIGSSATKVGLFGLDGEARALASRSYPTDEPMPGYREQDPEDWWTAVVEGIRDAMTTVPKAEVLAVGAAGHISSLTFLDGAGRPVRRSLGFQDQRAVGQLDKLYSTLGRRELADVLGIDLPPAATWPLPRLLWIRAHEEDTLRRTRRLLQAKDFINQRLTGAFASDSSSSRGMAVIPERRSAAEVFERLGLPDLVPPLFGPEEFIGRVTPEAAHATGLRAGVPVVAGWNDLNASVLGSGTVAPGDAFNVTGTSEHIGVVVTDECRVPELTCGPFLDGRKLLYGVTSCGGGSLEWYRNLTGKSVEELVAAADGVSPAPGSPVFLPYLQGERAPIWDGRASGALAGLRSCHGEGHVVRAILEGVAFSLRQINEIIEQHTTARDAPLVISGGAARLPPWNQLKADVLSRAVATVRNPHAGAMGAAVLAAVAAGAYPDCDSAAAGMVHPGENFDPRPDFTGCYDSLYRRYCELYPTLRDWFARLYEDRAEGPAGSPPTRSIHV